MSEKGKKKHAVYEARQEKKAKHIVNGIFIALIILAIIIVVLFSINT